MQSLRRFIIYFISLLYIITFFIWFLRNREADVIKSLFFALWKFCLNIQKQDKLTCKQNCVRWQDLFQIYISWFVHFFLTPLANFVLFIYLLIFQVQTLVNRLLHKKETVCLHGKKNELNFKSEICQNKFYTISFLLSCLEMNWYPWPFSFLWRNDGG